MHFISAKIKLIGLILVFILTIFIFLTLYTKKEKKIVNVIKRSYNISRPIFNQFERICKWHTYIMNQNSSIVYSLNRNLAMAIPDYGYCIPPFRNFRTRFRIAKTYKLAYGFIEKSMSSILRSMMCFLNHPNEYIMNNISILQETKFSNSPICNDSNKFDILSHEVQFNNEYSDYAFFTLVREPIERLTSSFIDKCINEKSITPNVCYGCNSNFTCLIERQFERTLYWTPNDTLIYEDFHFFPQNWFSHFNSMFNHVKVLKYVQERGEAQNLMYDELFQIFRGNNVPEEYINYFYQQIISGRTKHSTISNPVREKIYSQINSDNNLKLKILQLYYFDFLLFGYDISF